MKIGIDIRPLLDSQPSGVGEYTHELLRAIFEIDQENEYHLFSNAHSVYSLQSTVYSTPNVILHHFHYPNKLLNTSLRFFGQPKIDKLIIKHQAPSTKFQINSKSQIPNSKLDAFFMPNLNFVSLDPQTPLILTVHDLSFHLQPHFFTKKTRLWHRFIRPRKLIGRANQIIAQSKHTKDDLMRLFGVQEERITVIYPGLAPEFNEETNDFKVAAVRRRYNLPENFILFLATLEPRKNVASVIEAFELLKTDPRFTDLHLVLAGKVTPSFLHSHPFSNSRELEKGYIHILNYVTRDDRPALYKAARAFVYPSYYEGFGLPPLEAMSQGTPVIASHTSSLGEVLGNAAILIDPYNVEDLRTALTEVLTDESLATELSRRGHEQAKKFNWEQTAKQTLEVFKKQIPSSMMEEGSLRPYEPIGPEGVRVTNGVTAGPDA